MHTPTPTSTQAGGRLRELRKAAGLRQTEFAARVGCAQSAVSQIETGSRRGSVEMWSAFARVLGCSVGELLGEAEAA